MKQDTPWRGTENLLVCTHLTKMHGKNLKLLKTLHTSTEFLAEARLPVHGACADQSYIKENGYHDHCTTFCINKNIGVPQVSSCETGRGTATFTTFLDDSTRNGRSTFVIHGPDFASNDGQSAPLFLCCRIRPLVHPQASLDLHRSPTAQVGRALLSERGPRINSHPAQCFTFLSQIHSKNGNLVLNDISPHMACHLAHEVYQEMVS